MALINSDVIPASATGGYTIDQSLRFNDNDTAYLSRTPSSAGNRRTWTFSCWIKRGALGNKTIFSAGDNADVTSMGVIKFNAGYSNGVEFIDVTLGGGASAKYYRPLPAYRDSSAWYHLVVAVDTTQSTESNRVKLYMNGVAPTDFVTGYPTYPAQNTEYHINNTKPHFIGGYSYEIAVNPFDGYLSEVNFIDGQALDATYFGETGDYGEWKPIEYTGTYGTNGFYLDFDGTYYNDKSGNGNNWTANNLATTDVVLDSPTNNFATLNPLDYSGTFTTYEGNLKYTSNTGVMRGSMASDNQKMYLEYCQLSTVSSSTPVIFGIGSTNGRPLHESNHKQSIVVHLDNAAQNRVRVFIDNAQASNVAYSNLGSVSVGDIFQFAYDPSTGKAWVGHNNTWLDGSGGTTGNPSSGTNPTYTFSDTTQPMTAYVDHAGVSHTGCLNFGQDSSFAGNKTAQGNTDDNNIGDFYYTPPSGYLALCTANLPDPAVIPSEHFNTVLYSGNGTSQSITGVGFQPDWLWLKTRSATGNHVVFDAVRGTSARLRPSSTSAEDSSSITSFDSDGFTLGIEQNNGTATYVSWNWKANGSGVSNTNGSITSTVSANQDAGFSIVNFTGTGSNGTVGHGLSQAPEMMIFKRRDSGSSNWITYHKGIGNGYNLFLNLTNAKDTDGALYWQSTDPTSTVFTAGGYSQLNNSGSDTIGYCFHSVDGFSKVGSYTGNGDADGTFVYTGFRPAFVIVKRTNSSGSWYISDNKRDTTNPLLAGLYADSPTQEDNVSTSLYIDYVSNGFKLRGTYTGSNASGSTYIYMCFSENPFKHTNAK